MFRTWLWIAVAAFALAGVAGLFLRFMFVVEVPGANFRNILHGHSHLAMLGWLYPALFILLVRAFPEVVKDRMRKLHWLYIAGQITALAIFAIMCTTGYNSMSIGLLGLHIVMSYVFAVWFIRSTYGRKDPIILFARGGVAFMILSTLALWAIGPIMAAGLAGSALYYATIQFFLHFQLNGWYIFSALALFLSVLSSKGIELPERRLRLFFLLLIFSTILTYLLAVAWSTPLAILFVLNSVGVVVQLIALVLFGRIIVPLYQQAKKAFEIVEFRLYTVALACFGIKVIAQSLLVVPFIATVAYTVRNFVIGFMHLILLGMMTHLVLAACRSFGMLDKGKRSNTGLAILFAGFLLSELVLFGQGAMFWGAMGFMPGYYILLMAVSALIPIGAILVLPTSGKSLDPPK